MTWEDELSEPARAVLRGSAADRSAFVSKQSFIPTHDCIAALQWLSYLRRQYYGVDRPKNVHIVALPGMGKSRVLKQYIEQFSPVRDENGLLRREVVLIEMPEDGELRHLQKAIVTACLPGLEPNDRYSSRDVLEVLKACCVRQLLFDEMGNILNGSRLSQQRALAFIKSITNQGITVGVATTPRLKLALHADEQLASRFHVVEVRVWRESDELRSFLDAVERQLPFSEPSFLASPGMVRTLLAREELTSSLILEVLRDACRAAFISGEPNITAQGLRSVMESPFPPDGGIG